MKKFLIFAPVIFGMLFVASAGFASDLIDVWTRAKGKHTYRETAKRHHVVMVDLKKMRPSMQTAFDIQLEKTRKFKGIPLSLLTEKAKPKYDEDLYLLHFDNGMVIPVAKNPTEKFVYDLDRVFIALKVKDQKKWKKKFAPISRKGLSEYTQDPHPTEFKSNKPLYILSKAKFYTVTKSGVKTLNFTPWAHASSLKGIEFVNKKRYYKQLEVLKNSRAKNGFKVFKSRCQYCHGVRELGASFGWDVVDPVNLAKKRDRVEIHMFVKYPKLQPFDSKMPNQLDFSEQESKDVWFWMKSISKAKLAPY